MNALQTLVQMGAAGEFPWELGLGMGGLLSAAVLYFISEFFGGIHL